MASCFNLQFQFECRCGNNDSSEFYYIPKETVSNEGRIVFSNTYYRLVCKKCKKEYELKLTIKEE